MKYRPYTKFLVTNNTWLNPVWQSITYCLPRTVKSPEESPYLTNIKISQIHAQMQLDLMNLCGVNLLLKYPFVMYNPEFMILVDHGTI